jgi:hypothetical protein
MSVEPYEVSQRSDKRGVNLISDALPFSRLWYGEPNAVASAIDYGKFRSRSHRAVIRVYDEAGSERMRILPEGDATGAVAESGAASVVVYPLELALALV